MPSPRLLAILIFASENGVLTKGSKIHSTRLFIKSLPSKKCVLLGCSCGLGVTFLSLHLAKQSKSRIVPSVLIVGVINTIAFQMINLQLLETATGHKIDAHLSRLQVGLVQFESFLLRADCFIERIVNCVGLQIHASDHQNYISPQ